MSEDPRGRWMFNSSFSQQAPNGKVGKPSLPTLDSAGSLEYISRPYQGADEQDPGAHKTAPELIILDPGADYLSF